jgi:uncharacterized protein YaeQ
MGPEADHDGAKLAVMRCSDKRTHMVWKGSQVRFERSGKCLDADGTNNGDRPQIWSCDSNNGNQRWQSVGSGAYTWIVSPSKASTKCLDVTGGWRDGAAIQFWQCYADNNNQRWGYTVLD